MKAWLYRIIYFAIPLTAMALIVWSLNAGPMLMRPMGEDDDVEARLEEVGELALSGRWEEAAKAAEALQAAWNRVQPRIQYAYTREELDTFGDEVAALMGAVDGRSDTQVRISLRRLGALWNDFLP